MLYSIIYSLDQIYTYTEMSCVFMRKNILKIELVDVIGSVNNKLGMNLIKGK